MAWCLKYQHDLINLSFTKYTSAYKLHQGIPNDRLFFKRPILSRLLKRSFVIRFLNQLALSDKWLKLFKNWVLVLDKKDNETVSEEELSKSYSTKKILLIRAWDISCPLAMQAKQNEIRLIFNPIQEIINKVSKFIGKLPEHDLLVGLHARRGDYAKWEEGKYYFSWQLYKRWLQQIEVLLRERGKKVVFLICSDEKPPREIFSECNFHISDLDAFSDLHLLSSCDLQLGPPSSFGSWAEFFGQTKRICLIDSSFKINVEEIFDES